MAKVKLLKMIPLNSGCRYTKINHTANEIFF